MGVRDKITQTAAAFRLLADPTRCKILIFLNKRKDGACVYEVADAAGLTHSAASHQLGRLEREGVLESYREGQTICYMIADNKKAKALVRVLLAVHR